MPHQGVKIAESVNENIEPAVVPGCFGPLIDDNHWHIRLVRKCIFQVDLINTFSQCVVVQRFSSLKVTGKIIDF
jgi:hypothetical protein